MPLIQNMRFVLFLLESGVDPLSSDPTTNPTKTAGLIRFDQALQKAGVLLACDCVPSHAARAHISFFGGKPIVEEGPFASANGRVRKTWTIQVKSREEAIERAKLFPASEGDIIEICEVRPEPASFFDG